ncbi:uncharacterized protein [Argopecten irradians]
MYTSDNVLQYLGFNQVDLLHRCIYSVVHPDDHFDLKSVLEQSSLPGDPGCHQQRADNRDTARSTSFICRMKCFNGTAAGYLKIHCVGKVDSFSELSSKPVGSFLQVVRFYCQPFMLTGNDINDDVKQNVFWSKHDMDLKINELDKKAAAITGYDVDELNGRSIYDFVHPEDVAAFASCHKSLVESTDVQTTYFRFVTKDNRLIWLHSRGKVISKNSKKFSVVFTHCPVREEDSTFLQQESTLRQRYAIDDLLHLIQYGFYTNNTRTNTGRAESINQKANGQICTPHIGFTEDVSLSFYSALVSCPSTLHSMNDRHSPVLPSTHVAHKITQREKQLQFQEFRRRQEFEQERLVSGSQQSDFTPYFWQLQQPANVAQQQPPPEDCIRRQQQLNRPTTEISVCKTKKIKSEPVYDAPPPQCSFSQNPMFQYHNHESINCRPCVPYEPAMCPHPMPDQLVFSFPPSPPMSPRRFMPDRFAMFGSHQPGYYPGSAPSQRFIYNVEHHPYHFPPTYQNVISASNGQSISPFKTGGVSANNFHPSQNLSDANSLIRTKPHANIKLSMHCDYSTPKFQGAFGSCEPKFSPYSSKHHHRSLQPQIPYVTSQIHQQDACGQTNQVERESIQYDIEASIHMKIVDNSVPKCTDSKQEVDLPSIGSFLDYLNEG